MITQEVLDAFKKIASEWEIKVVSGDRNHLDNPGDPLHLNSSTSWIVIKVPERSKVMVQSHADLLQRVLIDLLNDQKQEKLIDILARALIKARRTIQSWHGPVGWDLYQESPEMKQINNAIIVTTGERWPKDDWLMNEDYYSTSSKQDI